MSNNKPPNNQQPVKIVSEEVVRQMVQNEANKIELQKQKLSLQSQNLEKQHDYACRALDAQREYLKVTPKEKRKDFITLGVFVVIIIVLVFVFFGFCIINHQIDLVLTIVKYIAIIVLSFTGGTFYGKSRASDKNRKLGGDTEFIDAEEVK